MKAVRERVFSPVLIEERRKSVRHALTARSPGTRGIRGRGGCTSKIWGGRRRRPFRPLKAPRRGSPRGSTSATTRVAYNGAERGPSLQGWVEKLSSLPACRGGPLWAGGSRYPSLGCGQSVDGPELTDEVGEQGVEPLVAAD
jgi:hypothetical protein